MGCDRALALGQLLGTEKLHKIIKMVGSVLCDVVELSVPQSGIVWECNHSLPLGQKALEQKHSEVQVQFNIIGECQKE